MLKEKQGLPNKSLSIRSFDTGLSGRPWKKAKRRYSNIDNNPVLEEPDEHKTEDIEVVEDNWKSRSDEVEDQEVKFKGVEDFNLSDVDKHEKFVIDEKSVALNTSFTEINFNQN